VLPDLLTELDGMEKRERLLALVQVGPGGGGGGGGGGTGAGGPWGRVVVLSLLLGPPLLGRFQVDM
jgi:hypothetical protein